MEMLKEPRNALATANLIGLIGSTAYFYKQMEVFRLDMIRLNDTLANVVHKITELEKRDGDKVDTLRSLSTQLKQINERMEQIPSLRSVKNIENDLLDIVHSLETKGIEIEASVPENRRRGGYDSDFPESGSRRRDSRDTREPRDSRDPRDTRDTRDTKDRNHRYDDNYRGRKTEPSFKEEPIELLIDDVRNGSEVRRQIN
jgi:hypothetical protein